MSASHDSLGRHAHAGDTPGVVSLTMGVAFQRLEAINRRLSTSGDSGFGPQCAGAEDSETLQSISVILHSMVSAEARRLAAFRSPTVPARGELFGDAARSGGGDETTCGGTTESDAPTADVSCDGVIVGDGGLRRISDRILQSVTGGSNRSGAGGECLSSLIPFILTAAFECPFDDIRQVFGDVLKRMRAELGICMPESEGSFSMGPWFSRLGRCDQRFPQSLAGLHTRATYFVEHGELSSPIRVLFSHWGDLADAHVATLNKLLFADEGPLLQFDRLLCALLASSAHSSEGLSRYICAIMLRGNSAGQTGVPKMESSCLGPSRAAGEKHARGGLRDYTERLLLSTQWPAKYKVARRVCAILARKPWSLRRSDLDPVLDHWSEPELIHMITIFSYFLGVGSLMAMLQVPCDYSSSYNVASLLAKARAAGAFGVHDVPDPSSSCVSSSDSSDSESDDSDSSSESSTDSGGRAFRNAALTAARSTLWISSEPFLSRLVNGNDNTDVVYHRRITKGGADCTLTTSMFSFAEGARSILDTFFPTAAADFADEFSILGNILNGGGSDNSVARVGVSDSLKLVPVVTKNLSHPRLMDDGIACTSQPQPCAQEHRVLDITDSSFWEAVRAYSMNVAGVVDLSYNYCDINFNVGKFAKAFALAATMQPESDPTDSTYGDPRISPSSFAEEECILALGLCAMYAKIEALLLRGLSIVR